MKKVIITFAVCIVCTSCTTLEQNVVRGATGGAIVGGVLGHQSGSAKEGAALGAVAGSLVGYLFTPRGNQRSPSNHPETVTIRRNKVITVQEQVPVQQEVTTKKYYVDPATGRKVYIYN
jgi:outer membrane lipoprotein SlyB